jgi:hypothetical protein
MSAQHHPPDKATPQTWRAWGVETAEETAHYETNDTPSPPLWQSGLTQSQISAVSDHRRSNPDRPLPERLQRAIGSAWAHAGALR